MSSCAAPSTNSPTRWPPKSVLHFGWVQRAPGWSLRSCSMTLPTVPIYERRSADNTISRDQPRSPNRCHVQELDVVLPWPHLELLSALTAILPRCPQVRAAPTPSSCRKPECYRSYKRMRRRASRNLGRASSPHYLRGRATTCGGIMVIASRQCRVGSPTVRVFPARSRDRCRPVVHACTRSVLAASSRSPRRIVVGRHRRKVL